MLLYRNKQRELIGYFGVRRFGEYIEGLPVAVFWAEARLQPEHRRRVRFYVDANPKFNEAKGLLTLIPVMIAQCGLVFHAFKKRLGTSWQGIQGK